MVLDLKILWILGNKGTQVIPLLRNNSGKGARWIYWTPAQLYDTKETFFKKIQVQEIFCSWAYDYNVSALQETL